MRKAIDSRIRCNPLLLRWKIYALLIAIKLTKFLYSSFSSLSRFFIFVFTFHNKRNSFPVFAVYGLQRGIDIFALLHVIDWSSSRSNGISNHCVRIVLLNLDNLSSTNSSPSSARAARGPFILYKHKNWIKDDWVNSAGSHLALDKCLAG